MALDRDNSQQRKIKHLYMLAISIKIIYGTQLDKCDIYHHEIIKINKGE